MVYVFLADGFEEMEAIAPVDILKRAGVDVITVGIGSKQITGSHKITIQADIIDSQLQLNDNCQGVILPGGLPGAENLSNSDVVTNAINFAFEKNLLLAAICAAPMVIGKKGFLHGKKAVCYPGFEKHLLGACVLKDAVCVDNNIITACGAGAAFKFSFELVEFFCGKLKRKELEESMLCDR